MGKMAEMKKTVEEFRQNNNIEEINNGVKINELQTSIENKQEENLVNEQNNVINEENKNIQEIDIPQETVIQETLVMTQEMKQELTQTMQNEETQVINNGEIKKEEVKPEEKFEDMYTSIFGTAPIKEKIVEEEPEEYKVPEPQITTGENISVFEEQGDYNAPKYKFIGIAFSTYIIIELDKELYIIDQHAAHERIMYEKVKENYYRDDNKDSQLMLLPDIITLTHKEMDIAKDNMEMFKKAGFELEEFGENTIRLTGVPNICLELDTKELFLETLDEINTVARTAKQEIEEKFIATVACKAAVKANMALTKEEVDSLMEKLLKLPNPFTCPHGRPTAIKMTKTDIEKKFSRR